MSARRKSEEGRCHPDWSSVVVEFSGEAIIGAGIDGLITTWNPAAAKMFGYTREEIVGRPVVLLTPESHAQQTRAIIAQISAGRPVEHLETFRVRKDGSVFPVSLTVAPIFDEERAVVGMSGIASDLAQLWKGLEAAQLVAAIVRHSDDAIIGATLEGIITSWNPAAEKMYGYTSEEATGKSLELITPDDLVDEMKAILAKVRTGIPVEHLETLSLRRDGTTFPVSLTFSPILNHGVPSGATTIARDMTELQSAKQELDHLVSLLESSNAAVMGETDAIIGGTLDGIITSWNPGAARMFGYAGQEVIGHTFRLLVPEDRVDEVLAIELKAREGQATEGFESVRVRRDGSTFPVALANSPITDAGGTVIGVSTIVRDLSGKKRDQREIADWRDKAFKWMEELEQSQRLGVQREFERELVMMDLQAEIERLRRLVPPDPREPGDKH